MAHTSRRLPAALCLGLSLAAAAAQAASQTIVRVLPPPRPADLAAEEDYENLVTGSIPRSSADGVAPLPVQRAASRPIDSKTAIEKANATLNAINSMEADFTQVNGDGRRASGTLYMQRPGKVRFEYDKPSTLEVVSDGSTVLVRDRKLNTSDPYPIGQTALKFLLSSRIDITRDATLRGVTADEGVVRIEVEDRATLGGTSRITLSFDGEVANLRGWKVVDPQGFSTTVALSDVRRNVTIDPRTFMLNYSRPVN